LDRKGILRHCYHSCQDRPLKAFLYLLLGPLLESSIQFLLILSICSLLLSILFIWIPLLYLRLLLPFTIPLFLFPQNHFRAADLDLVALLLASFLYYSSIIPLFASFLLRAIFPFARAPRHLVMCKQQDLEINRSVLQVYFLYGYFINYLFCFCSQRSAPLALISLRHLRSPRFLLSFTCCFLPICQHRFSLALSFEVWYLGLLQRLQVYYPKLIQTSQVLISLKFDPHLLVFLFRL
jgi:hypothetical protein